MSREDDQLQKDKLCDLYSFPAAGRVQLAYAALKCTHLPGPGTLSWKNSSPTCGTVHLFCLSPLQSWRSQLPLRCPPWFRSGTGFQCCYRDSSFLELKPILIPFLGYVCMWGDSGFWLVGDLKFWALHWWVPLLPRCSSHYFLEKTFHAFYFLLIVTPVAQIEDTYPGLQASTSGYLVDVASNFPICSLSLSHGPKGASAKEGMALSDSFSQKEKGKEKNS